MIIPHNKPSLSDMEVKAVTDVINTNFIVQGDKVLEFEKDLSEYINVKNCVVLNSGTTSIYLALYALNVKEGDEVIIPTYVCSALLNAIYLHRAVPVLVDVNVDDYNIDWEKVALQITLKTKAIIVPHIHGMPAFIPSKTFNNIPIVEDCATAISSKLNGKNTGCLGTLSVLSFYATKYITTGEGGAILTQDGSITDVIRDYREFDCRENYVPRFNFQMTDMQATLGSIQLKRISSFISKRKFIAEHYQSFFTSKGVAWQCSSNDVEYNNYRFVINIEEKKRDLLQERLLKNGIKTIIPIERRELLHNYLKLSDFSFPVAEHIAATTLSLPIYPELDDQSLSYLLKTLKKIL